MQKSFVYKYNLSHSHACPDNMARLLYVDLTVPTIYKGNHHKADYYKSSSFVLNFSHKN